MANIEFVQGQESHTLMNLACETEGASYDTGIRIQGLEVWGIPPHKYRHYTEFYLQYPQSFSPEVKETKPGNWEIGYVANDGVFRSRYSSFKSKEEAESKIIEFGLKEFYPNCPINVFYTKTGKVDGSFADKESGIACGVPLTNHGCNWDVFNITVLPEEAEALLNFGNLVQAEWEKRAKSWRDHEAKKLEAVAKVVASEGLINHNGLTECFECGATFDEPGHVEWGGMGCDYCG